MDEGYSTQEAIDAVQGLHEHAVRVNVALWKHYREAIPGFHRNDPRSFTLQAIATVMGAVELQLQVYDRVLDQPTWWTYEPYSSRDRGDEVHHYLSASWR